MQDTAVRYKYEFLTECRFDPPVNLHSFKLRVQPMACDCQEVLNSQVVLTPINDYCQATDGFGNSVIYGLISSPHDHFQMLSSGLVACGPYILAEHFPAEYYRYPTPLTQWNGDLRQLGVCLSPADIMRVVHERMRYERFQTDNTTTAIEAFASGVGVCQDFAHVMIAVCRSVGYLTRYVCGLIVGEGETHAWVEVYQDGYWHGYDPTYGSFIREGYIKLAHGRDANDCPINRGRFYNWTTERMIVKCKVTHDTDGDIS